MYHVAVVVPQHRIYLQEVAQYIVHLIQERYLVQESQYVTEGLFGYKFQCTASGGDGSISYTGIKTEEVVLFRVRYRQHTPPVQQVHTRERRQMDMLKPYTSSGVYVAQGIVLLMLEPSILQVN
ncbi:MAG: hypothetical protein CM15mP65_00400 [Crocinitomicaceae bacterium]|nr:MAG: hypothetical protein CM15mP65_00400 [Crocinitomicaceae bacterium]